MGSWNTAGKRKSQFLKFSFCCLVRYLYYIPTETRVSAGRGSLHASSCIECWLVNQMQNVESTWCFILKSQNFSLAAGTRCLRFELPLGKWKLTANPSDYFPTLPECPQRKTTQRFQTQNSLNQIPRKYSVINKTLSATNWNEGWNSQ